MSIIQRLVNVATRELELERSPHLEEMVDARLAGHLAEIPGATASKEEYVKAGLDFLEYFPTSCAAKIGGIRETIDGLNDEENSGEISELKEIITGIQKLEAEAKHVDRAEFAAAIGEDWDEAVENMRWGSDFEQK